MKLEETKIYAADYVISALCSGNEFRGLGSIASYLVMTAAQGANENAQMIFPTFGQSAEEWKQMKITLTEEFVMSILGFGEVKQTPTEAAAHLVERVFDYYIDWAEAAARDADPELR
jgi:hypothetical protein